MSRERRFINGRIPVLFPPEADHNLIRKVGAAAGYILKHDDATGMLSFVPAEQCQRPACDVEPAPVAPKVVSIANVQRKEKPETFLGKFKRFTMPDHDTDPTPPRAA